ncbi:MAG: hypothetical protein RIB86_23780 [Imperialibacter sp.]
MKTNLTKLGALSIIVSFFLFSTSCGSSDKSKDNAEDLAAAEFDAAEQELENEKMRL